MNRVLKPIIYLLFSFLWLLSFSQQTNIKFGHLSLKDGLSQSEVLCIIQDKKGLMWFGTQDGLNQYNGYEFKIFSQDILDSLSISNSFIHDIHQDENGLIWLATENGLNVYYKANNSFKNILKGNFLGKANRPGIRAHQPKNRGNHRKRRRCNRLYGRPYEGTGRRRKPGTGHCPQAENPENTRYQ